MVVVEVQGLAGVVCSRLSAVLDPCFVVFGQIPRERNSQSPGDEVTDAQVPGFW